MQEYVDFSGGLNQDDEVLPRGDYKDAKNIVIEGSTAGGAGAIKKMESTEVPTNLTGLNNGTVTLTDGTIKASTKDSSGNLYVLISDTSNAIIWKITYLEGTPTKTSQVEYEHNSCTITEPDLFIVDDVLVWNYHGSGVPLYWLTTRSPITKATLTDSDVALTHLSFIKAPPNYPPAGS